MYEGTYNCIRAAYTFTEDENEAVRNNLDKFPEDYMFALTSEELQDLRTKISTTNISSKKRREIRGTWSLA